MFSNSQLIAILLVCMGGISVALMAMWFVDCLKWAFNKLHRPSTDPENSDYVPKKMDNTKAYYAGVIILSLIIISFVLERV